MKPNLLILLLFVSGFLLPACAPQKASMKRGSSLVSDTLYFGTSTSKGPVTQGQWNTFLSSVVTPRFPEGLTVWDAKGQWRGKSGAIGKEPTKVLLLIHPDSPQADRALQEIIDAYKKQFQQESVMRVKATVDVSF